MKLSEIKANLQLLNTLQFQLPDRSFVPSHFHVTEVGAINKHFIDCGGTLRQENVINFQLWEAGDFDHRLTPQKLKDIIELSEKLLELADNEIEVEYQTGSIGKYGLDFDGEKFILTNKQTDCLAKNSCGIPENELASDMVHVKTSCCTPDGSCC